MFWHRIPPNPRLTTKYIPIGKPKTRRRGKHFTETIFLCLHQLLHASKRNRVETKQKNIPMLICLCHLHLRYHGFHLRKIVYFQKLYQKKHPASKRSVLLFFVYQLLLNIQILLSIQYATIYFFWVSIIKCFHYNFF
jgi:hypothetical protein